MLWRGLLPMTFLMVIVLGSIFAGWATATESAGVGVFGAMLIAGLNGKLEPRDAATPRRRRPRQRDGVPDLLRRHRLLLRLPRARRRRSDAGSAATLGIDTKWEILGLLMVLIFLLGFPFEWLEICLIVLPVFVPILQKLDFASTSASASHFMPWFATLVAVNLQTSFMTPPFGATLFYMKGTAPPESR